VEGADGAFVCRGLWNSRSQIVVRGYRWEDEPLDRSFWQSQLRLALGLRRTLAGAGRTPPPETGPGAVRLVFSEGDGLSGLTVDRYGDWLTVQFTSLAIATRRELLLDILEEELRPKGIVLRTEKGIGEEEGLELKDGLVRGETPPEPLRVQEEGLSLAVDLGTGQKTGFYLDQRDTRRRLTPFAPGRRVADVCCYTGAFSLALARGGAASVVGIDMSAPALELAGVNAASNGLADRVRFERSDAVRWLEGEAAARRSYDLIVLDPPRFARSRKGLPSALKGYARLNEAALQCLEPGGILMTCSCSGRVSREDFQGVLGGVAAKTGRRIQILETGGQAPDHPVSASCPESAYLKAVLTRVE